jgi:maleylacetate reductase
MAEEAIAAMARALPGIVRDPRDQDARSDALYGAWLCGLCLGAVGMALHHKLCHTLGGRFNLPHAETHTAVLPHALAYNAAAVPDAMTRINRALGTTEAPGALFDMARDLGAKMALSDLGMPHNGIDVAVDLAVSNPYWNPSDLAPNRIRELLVNAYEGRRP